MLTTVWGLYGVTVFGILYIEIYKIKIIRFDFSVCGRDYAQILKDYYFKFDLNMHLCHYTKNF